MSEQPFIAPHRIALRGAGDRRPRKPPLESGARATLSPDSLRERAALCLWGATGPHAPPSQGSSRPCLLWARGAVGAETPFPSAYTPPSPPGALPTQVGEGRGRHCPWLAPPMSSTLQTCGPGRSWSQAALQGCAGRGSAARAGYCYRNRWLQFQSGRACKKQQQGNWSPRLPNNGSGWTVFPEKEKKELARQGRPAAAGPAGAPHAALGAMLGAR